MRGRNGRYVMTRHSLALALLLAGLVVAASSLSSLSAPKTTTTDHPYKCEPVCNHCPSKKTSQCTADCLDCRIRSFAPTQLAPAPATMPTGTAPLPAQKAE